MELLKCLTVLVLVVCMALANAASRTVNGRCCAARKGGGGGGCETPSGNFSPPLFSKEEMVVSWVAQDLDCNPKQSVVYYELDNTTGNHLQVRGDELILSFKPLGLFSRLRREYCIEAHGEGYRGAVCQPDPEKICGDAVCIPKCCGDGEMFDGSTCDSVRGSGNMSLPFYFFHGNAIPAPSNVVMVGDMVPDCGDGFPTILEDMSELHLLVNGKLLDREIEIVHELNHYCVDMYLGDDQNPVFMVCSEAENMTVTVKHHLQRIGYIISVIFLVVTILCHIFIKKLQDIPGMCLISHMVSMAVADIFLYILSVPAYGISPTFCLFSAFVLLFSFLAMFFWLNIMCFDIWRVIRATARVIPLSGILSNDAKKFRIYCLYGWGVPLLVVVVAAIMHTLPEEHAKNIIRPGFGIETCWLLGDMELLIYCYAYVGALFILDLVFLGHTMLMLRQAGGGHMCCTQQDSVTAFNRNQLEAFWQRFALFILMVLAWTTEIISWKIPPQEIWIVSDFVNSSQGFLVFIIFISSRRRREMVINLMKKLPCFRRLRNTIHPTSNQTATWHVNTTSPSLSAPSINVTGVAVEQQSLQNSKTDSSGE